MAGKRHHPSPAGKKFNSRVGAKISKVEHEGVRGHKVSHAQAVAVAISMENAKYKKAHGGHSAPSVVKYNRAHHHH